MHLHSLYILPLFRCSGIEPHQLGQAIYLAHLVVIERDAMFGSRPGEGFERKPIFVIVNVMADGAVVAGRHLRQPAQQPRYSVIKKPEMLAQAHCPL